MLLRVKKCHLVGGSLGEGAAGEAAGPSLDDREGKHPVSLKVR